MATLTYTIDSTTNAYTILADGVPWIVQPFPRDVAGTAPFATAADSEAEAVAVIAELNAAP